MKKFIILLALTANIFSLFSQVNLATKSEKAIRYYKEAQSMFNAMRYDNAYDLFKKAIKEDKNFVDAYFTIGEIFYNMNEIDSMINWYTMALAINPYHFKEGFVMLANAQNSTGRFDEAIVNYKMYLSFDRKNEKIADMARLNLSRALFASEAIKNPVPFNPENLGENVNSEYEEYWPSLSVDEEILIFTVMLPIDNHYPARRGNRQEDFFYCEKDTSGKWMPRRRMPPPVNTMGNEGGQSISADGKYIVFTGCNRSDGYGMCDLYFTELKGYRWSTPTNLGSAINTSVEDKQPSLSADGRVLFFSSRRGGGKGGYDIWMSIRNDDGSWSSPANLGKPINTPFDEVSPFLHSDNMTLYFSSDGHPGIGDHQDIFFSRKNNDSSWSEPVNIGYPINTIKDEIGFFVNAEGDVAYFSSDIKDNNRDIYRIDLYPEARPVQVSYMKGKVYDAASYEPLDATFELVDLNSGQLMFRSVSDKQTGEFLVAITANKNYALNAYRNGYLFYSENFSLQEAFSKLEPFIKDVPMNKISEGKTIVLKNIFFETDKYTLKNESKTELDKIVQFLKDNSTVKIEISGHTDNTGDDNYNITLSENRAKSVVEYISGAEIPIERLLFKGYGESMPVASNDTEQGKAQNRRTELKIISK